MERSLRSAAIPHALAAVRGMWQPTGQATLQQVVEVFQRRLRQYDEAVKVE